VVEFWIFDVWLVVVCLFYVVFGCGLKVVW